MIFSRVYGRLSLVLLASSGVASGFINVVRPNKISHHLQATKKSRKSKSSAATVVKEKKGFEKAKKDIVKAKKDIVKEKKEEIANDSDRDFDDILRTRRTVNSFVPILPNGWEETLDNAIESAIYAPNHKRTEPWRFHLLGPEAIRKVCELNASIVTEKKGKKAGQAKLERWLEMPGWLVVSCNTKDGTGDMADPTGIDREDYAAVCCAVQNLCLSLHNAGMGTKWTTGPVNFDSKFNTIVGLEKGEYVVGTLWFGTPESNPSAPLKKKKVTDVLRKTK